MMRNIRLIAARELGAYFDSSIAYVYTIAFVVLANSIFMNEFFLIGRAEMNAFFDRMPMLLAIFLPAITMRLWAEERKSRTIELLLTLPIQPVHAVMGKYVAAAMLYGMFLIGTLPIPIMISVLGEPDVGQLLSGYIGLILLGGMFLTFGMALSSLTGDQIVAFVSSAVLGFAFVLLGHERVVPVLDGLWPSLTIGTLVHDHLSIVPRYESFVRGVIDLASVLYFTLFAAMFLWLNVQVLTKDRA